VVAKRERRDGTGAWVVAVGERSWPGTVATRWFAGGRGVGGGRGGGGSEAE
jgi:hypothetical protein